MNNENENKNMTNEEIGDTVAEEVEIIQENTEETSSEEKGEQIEPVNLEEVEREIMEEFAPKPIEIPKYDKERELEKRDKAKKKQKVKNNKKIKKRKRMVKKILNVTLVTILTIFLIVISTVTVASVIVRLNTSGFAIENAISDSRPETYTIGRLSEELREDLILVESSPEAGLADIIKDNAKGTVKTTYKTIEDEIEKSTYSEFVAGVASNVIDYYLYGESYSPLTRKDISEVVAKNSSKIDYLTGRKLFQQQYDDVAKSVLKSKAAKELSAESLNKQKSAKITGISSAVLSIPMMAGMVVALILMIVLIIILCSGYSHKIIGASFMVAGAVSAVAGFLYKPMFHSTNRFINCVVDAIVQNFNKNALIGGVIVFALGLLIVFLGSAFSDRDIDSEDIDYIDEIEVAEEN